MERRKGMKGKKIMVIDDETIVCNMTKAVLEQDGYYVECFSNGEPALERLKQENFDLVITDLKMKGIDGMEVLKRIKTDSSEIKVIMITAFASLDAAIEALRGKVDDFFPKPVKFSDLKACIRRLLTQEPGPLTPEPK
jgi:DNA-binding NtrC family response regulator